MALAPVGILLCSLLVVILTIGARSVADYSCFSLLLASASAIVLTAATGRLNRRSLKVGWFRSTRQILPTIPMLICIAMIATTWLLSGVVPVLINYGLQLISPTLFLVVACGVCSVISVLSGSSWSTIATIGVAFIGIGHVLGFPIAWVAGAIISGAYFGDKISPLSDTTVVASSACGVDLFAHMRYLMLTSVPAMLIALGVYLCVGLFTDTIGSSNAQELISALSTTFNLTPWVLTIPVITLILIGLRVPTTTTLFISALLGFGGIFLFQPQLGLQLPQVLRMLWSGSDIATANPLLTELAQTGGILGMLPTIALILSAMTFGAVMIGTGMIASITGAITRHLKKRTSIVGATVASGLFMNSATADQYLSLIITGAMYRSVYQRFGLQPRLLSRTIEDSVSVTSVLIPWNSCGITQSTVLGVATLAYLPCCIFNILSPCMSLLLAWTGFKIPSPTPVHTPALNP